MVTQGNTLAFIVSSCLLSFLSFIFCFSPPAADIDSITPVIRDRDALSVQLDTLKSEYSTWEREFIARNQLGSRRPTMAEMKADPVAFKILQEIAPIRKKKEAYDKIIERYQKGENKQE